MPPPFGNNPWKQDGIWGNGKNVIGSTFSSQRDLPGSRGSDEASPTTVSGSAQLNHQSEAETPTWGSRNAIWNNQDSSNQGRSSSGTASPNQTRDSLGQQSLQDSRSFQPRTGVAQNSNAFGGRSKLATAFPPPFGSINDNLDNASSYPAVPSKYAFDGASAFKRGSQGEFPTLGPSRENSISGPRQSDFSSQTTPGSMNQDIPQYPFEGSSRGSISRPSGPPQSVSFPSSGNPTRGLTQTGLDQGLSELLSGSMSINDSRGADVAGRGFNPASRPFQFNPSSQAWNGDVAIYARGYGQTYQDVYGDQSPATYMELKRGSIERASPSSLSFPRNGLNSPRYTPGVGSRYDSWSQRPTSRGPSMPQDFDRQSSTPFSQVPNNYYPSGSYYGNNFPSQYPQAAQPYDMYGQNAGFRSQVAVAPFGMPGQYMPQVNIPVRPSRDQDPGKGVRSVLLEDFRASNRSNRRFELKDIYSYVVEFSGDQHGSRFIQEKLQNANSDEKDQVFQEIKTNALPLMKDVFGNYVIQKFFEHGSQIQKTILAREMNGKVAELSTQMYACRVVQKVIHLQGFLAEELELISQQALEHVLVDQQAEIVEELKPDMMRILKDQNGNHVVQKIISLVPQMSVPFMMASCRGQISTLSSHNYGCRVVQRMLEKGNEEQRMELMAEIHACASSLIADQYGNYVAQHILEHGSADDRGRFVKLIIDSLIELSVHKFASNVVEKCVEFGTPTERRIVMTKLITPDSTGRHPLDRVMLDQYGNYVMQNVADHLQGQDKADLLSEMKRRFEHLKKTVTSRQMGAIERTLVKHEQWLGQWLSEHGSENNPDAKAGSGQPSGRNLPPGLQIDSTATTPALSSENSSPKSDGSASTKAGDETISNAAKTIVEPTLGAQPEVVDVEGAES
ncbi:hypothetical protein SCUP234_12433 [Seiridium cupressi]